MRKNLDLMEKFTGNGNQRIGLGIAGLGFGEKVHLTASYTNKHLIPVALWHNRQDRLDLSCKKHNLKGYTEWDGLLKDPKIDAIIIATPPEPRFQLAKEALEAGKHLLLEKPVALNSKEIVELQKLAIKKQLSVSVDFEYRAVPLFMQAKKMLEEDLVGTPWLIKLDWLMSSRADEKRKWNWYSQKEKGGGVIGALGTHAFDLLHWFFGPTKTVTSLISTSIKERDCPKTNSKKIVSSEDICMAQLELAGINSNLSLPVQVTLSAISRQGRGFWLEIYGSNGTLILGSNNQKDYVHGFGMWYAEKNKNLLSVNPDKNFAFEKTWEDGRIAPVARVQSYWADSIINGNPVIPGLREGLASQKVCDKIKESFESGSKIEIDGKF